MKCTEKFCLMKVTFLHVGNVNLKLVFLIKFK